MQVVCDLLRTVAGLAGNEHLRPSASRDVVARLELEPHLLEPDQLGQFLHSGTTGGTATGPNTRIMVGRAPSAT